MGFFGIHKNLPYTEGENIMCSGLLSEKKYFFGHLVQCSCAVGFFHICAGASFIFCPMGFPFHTQGLPCVVGFLVKWAFLCGGLPCAVGFFGLHENKPDIEREFHVRGGLLWDSYAVGFLKHLNL